MLDLLWADHSRSVIDGLHFVLKFRLRLIYSFGNNTTYMYILEFWLVTV